MDRHPGRRFLLVTIAALLAIGLSAGGRTAAQTQGYPPTVVAIIDVEAILRQSTAMEAARAQIEQMSVSYKEEIEAEEGALRQAGQELQQQRSILSPEAFAERRQQWQQREFELNRKAQAMRRNMDNAFQAALQRAQEVLFDEVGELAEERGVTLVLPRSQIVVAAEGMDLTEEALARFNERLPSINIEFTGPAATPSE